MGVLMDMLRDTTGMPTARATELDIGPLIQRAAAAGLRESRWDRRVGRWFRRLPPIPLMLLGNMSTPKKAAPRKLRLGQVVTLASGGPLMTVVTAPKGGAVVCEWFDSAGLNCSNSFPVEALR